MAPSPETAPIHPWQINVLGIFLFIASIINGYLIYAFWPDVEDSKNWSEQTYLLCSSKCPDDSTALDTTKITRPAVIPDSVASPSHKAAEDCASSKKCAFCIELKAEQRIILLVLLAGAFGSFIHASTSFSNFVGQGELEKSWIWWYLLRPVIGMGVAMVFYMVFRGGLLNNTRIEDMNVYGIMTVSVLSGLFTDRATLKLQEIFQALFQPKDERKDKLDKETNEPTNN